MSKFRENLRNELDFQDKKVKELSEKSGISKSTLECYLRTQSVEPSAENAVKIARALQVSVEYLITGRETGNDKFRGRHSREAYEIIHWVESLSTEQCKALLKVVKTFEG